MSGFGGHIVISGCRSLSQSHERTLFEVVVIKYTTLAVGICIQTVVVREIKIDLGFLVFAHTPV